MFISKLMGEEILKDLGLVRYSSRPNLQWPEDRLTTTKVNIGGIISQAGMNFPDGRSLWTGTTHCKLLVNL